MKVSPHKFNDVSYSQFLIREQSDLLDIAHKRRAQAFVADAMPSIGHRVKAALGLKTAVGRH